MDTLLHSAPGLSLQIGNNVYTGADGYAPVDLNFDENGAGGGFQLVVDNDGITVATDVPVDMTQSYAAFVQNKKDAMTSGGSGSFGDASYAFDIGYLGEIVEKCLMSVNSVHGPDIYIIPSTSIWESVRNYPLDHINIEITNLPRCSKNDYNKLYALEMVLYHAINKIGWRILRDGPTTPCYGPGTWQQYQGLLAAWSQVAYRSQYVVAVTALRENLGINIGWVNPTCNTYSFLVVASITMENHVQASLYRDLIFYPGNTLSNVRTDVSDTNIVDNNALLTAIDNNTIYFVADPVEKEGIRRIYTNINSLAMLNGAIRGLGNTTLDFSGYEKVKDVSDLANATNRNGGYILGAMHYGVGSNIGYIKQFSLGLKPLIDYRATAYDTGDRDVYSVSASWFVKEGSSQDPAIGIIQEQVDKNLGNFLLYPVLEERQQ